MTPHDDIGAISVDIANGIQSVCAGKPTAAVYLAIAQLLGFMEMQSTTPIENERQRLFGLLSGAMDDFIQQRRAS